MDLENCGDGDHSTEIQLAWKKFEDVCSSLESEHTKLLDLETRRQKLCEDLERLRTEINDEKKYFHEQYSEEMENGQEQGDCEQFDELRETIDTGAIKEFIRSQRQELAAADQKEEQRSFSCQNIETDAINQTQIRYEDDDNWKEDDPEIFEDFEDPMEHEQFENFPVNND